jgi:hypothetical protein
MIVCRSMEIILANKETVVVYQTQPIDRDWIVYNTGDHPIKSMELIVLRQHLPSNDRQSNDRV